LSTSDHGGSRYDGEFPQMGNFFAVAVPPDMTSQAEWPVIGRGHLYRGLHCRDGFLHLARKRKPLRDLLLGPFSM